MSLNELMPAAGRGLSLRLTSHQRAVTAEDGERIEYLFQPSRRHRTRVILSYDGRQDKPVVTVPYRYAGPQMLSDEFVLQRCEMCIRDRRCATRSPPSWMTPRSNARASIPPHAPKRSTWRPSCDWHARRPICRITPTPSEPHCPTSSSSGSTFAALSLASCTRQSGQSLSTSFQKTFE